MKKFLKENWFKLSIIIVLLAIGISAVYYFAFFSQEQRNSSEQKISNNQTSLENIDLQEKCSNAAKIFFNNDNWGKLSDADRISYINHYSMKYNQCFILISEYAFDPTDKSHAVFQWLYNVFENKQYAQITYNNASTIFCSILPSDCKSSTEYNRYVSEYMEN